MSRNREYKLKPNQTRTIIGKKGTDTGCECRSEKDANRPPVITVPTTRCEESQDALNTEFIYYNALLKNLAPALSNESDKQNVLVPWIRKLLSPEYHSSMFKGKRNRFLLSMVLNLLNDELCGVFSKKPPSGALPDYSTLKKKFPQATWQKDGTWKDILNKLPSKYKDPSCSVHGRNGNCESESEEMVSHMDQEFKFLLYLVEPYAALLPAAEDKTKIGSWIQALCAIGVDSCAVMKGIRNDYVKALLGYVSTLNVSGPFVDYPPSPPLPPLQIAARRHARSHPFTDPTSRETNEFLQSQPIPENGAFLYVAVSGDLADDSVYQKTGIPGEEPYVDEAADESEIEHIITTGLNRLPYKTSRGPTKWSLESSDHLTSFGSTQYK